MIAILFTLYSILLGYLFGADQFHMALFALILVLSITSTYYGRKDFLVFSILANAVVISEFIILSNSIGTLSIFYIVAIVVPILASLEISLKSANGKNTAKAKGMGKARYIYPLSYIALIASVILILGRSPLYRIYFLGEGNTQMQILMIIAFACLFFMPLYEKNSL